MSFGVLFAMILGGSFLIGAGVADLNDRKGKITGWLLIAAGTLNLAAVIASSI